MRQVLFLLGAAIGLFFASASATKTYLHVTKTEYLGFLSLQIEENYREKYKAWFQACDYSPYSCIGINPPKVVSEIMYRNLLGYYDGSDTVFVNRRLKGQMLNEVLMHEMIHYLQAKVGGLPVPGPAKLICKAEEEAFTIVDQWLLEHGYEDLMVGPEWWKPYDHCYQWYGPKYNSAPPGGWFGFTPREPLF